MFNSLDNFADDPDVPSVEVVRRVNCPTCEAAGGARCVTRFSRPGEPMKVHHAARVSRAMGRKPEMDDSPLTDTEAMDLIARELSGEEWSADTFDVIAAYVRGTGRAIADVWRPVA